MYLYDLSVVIPTKNRSFYANQVVRQVLFATNEKVQVVVQDNSDSNELWQKLSDIYETRLKYVYDSKQLTLVENFEAAVTLAEGEYVILIGDDDGILPNITKVVQFLKDNNLDAGTSKVTNTYYWPNSGAKSLRATEESGYIRIGKNSNRIQILDSKERLKGVVNNGCQFYSSSGIPKIYHGLVKNELIKNIKFKYGNLFSGLVPDIYSSFMISLNIDKVAFFDYPFSIDGNCRVSGAGSQAQGKHTGLLSDVPQLKNQPNYIWNKDVIKIYSVQTIWADSGLAALKTMGANDYIKLFKPEILAAYTLLNNRSYAKNIFNEYLEVSNKNRVNGFFTLFFCSFRGPFQNILKRIFYRVRGFGQTGLILNNISDISEASEKIYDELVSKNVIL